MKKGVSVIVCCYNSALRIPDTLHHLFRQVVPEDLSWEIVLVNNNSKDNTVEVARSVYDKLNKPVSFKIVDESTPGLSHARERGVKESEFGYILFCDDDNHMVNTYVATGFQILEQRQDVAMLGGIGEPLLEGEEPKWFRLSYRMYAVGAQEEGRFDLTQTKAYTYGAGTFLRKKAYQELKNKKVRFLLTDRIGKKLVSGGDNEIGYLLVAAGNRILWDERLKFKHFIPADRINLDYIKRMRYGAAFTHEILMTYKSWLSEGKNTRTAKVVLGEFIDSVGITLRLFPIKLKRKKENFSFVVKYYFHLGRMLDFIQNGAKYAHIHREVENNFKALGFTTKSSD